MNGKNVIYLSCVQHGLNSGVFEHNRKNMLDIYFTKLPKNYILALKGFRMK